MFGWVHAILHGQKLDRHTRLRRRDASKQDIVCKECDVWMGVHAILHGQKLDRHTRLHRHDASKDKVCTECNVWMGACNTARQKLDRHTRQR